MSAERVASSITAAPGEPKPQSIISKRLPLWTRFNFFLRTWFAKFAVKWGLRIIRLLKASKFRAIAPTFTRRYDVRPTLESRFFLPKNYVSGTKLPLFMNIHGGGFVLCDPAEDDEFCHYLANHISCCVVSLDYRKAPTYPFPIPGQDASALVRAVLADDTLPIDTTKVALGGFSAGAALTLGIAQEDDLKGKIKGIVPVYPPCDFSSTVRGPYLTTPDGKKDLLLHGSKMFSWAYISPGTDLKQPYLSSVFATRQQIPQKAFFIGCEYDCLCHEANVLAKKLAGFEDGADPGPAWSKNDVRWELIPGVQHGFDKMELSGGAEVERQQLSYEMYDKIGAWLEQEVFQN